MNNNDDPIIIVNQEQVPCKHKNININYEYYKYEVLGFKKDNPLYFSIYEIPPGKSNYQYHYHERNYELFYILSGNGLLKTPDGDKRIKAGDIIFCPPSKNAAHKISNPSVTETLKYLDFDVLYFPEIMHYPDTQKIGIFLSEEDKQFFLDKDNVEYYEGE